MSNKTYALSFLCMMVSLVTSLWSSQLHAKNDCNVQIQLNEDINFARPISPQVMPVVIRVSRQNRSVFCNFVYLGFSTGQVNNYQRRLFLQQDKSHTLEYNIYRDANNQLPLKSLEDARMSEERVEVYIPPGDSSTNVTIYARLPFPNLGREFFRKGFYRDQVTITAKAPFSFDDSNAIANISVLSYMEPSLDIALVDRGAGFDMDDTSQVLNFGELTQGDQLGFDLRVRSNAGYAISVSSQNNGSLKHSQYKDKIQYKFKVNSSEKNLSNSAQAPVEVARYVGLTSTDGHVLPIDVEIQSVKNKQHGPYMDYITITAMSTE